MLGCGRCAAALDPPLNALPPDPQTIMMRETAPSLTRRRHPVDHRRDGAPVPKSRASPRCDAASPPIGSKVSFGSQTLLSALSH